MSLSSADLLQPLSEEYLSLPTETPSAKRANMLAESYLSHPDIQNKLSGYDRDDNSFLGRDNRRTLYLPPIRLVASILSTTSVTVADTIKGESEYNSMPISSNLANIRNLVLSSYVRAITIEHENDRQYLNFNDKELWEFVVIKPVGTFLDSALEHILKLAIEDNPHFNFKEPITSDNRSRRWSLTEAERQDIFNSVTFVNDILEALEPILGDGVSMTNSSEAKGVFALLPNFTKKLQDTFSTPELPYTSLEQKLLEVPQQSSDISIE